jgi:hypothetical protein
VPLGQLPPELLGRILYHTLWHDSRPAIYQTVKLHDIYRPTWIQSTLTCRHVRAVALQTPKLWTVITDTLCENRARWAAVCAKRAGAYPLTIISSVLCKRHAVRFLPDAVWDAAGAIEMQAVCWQPLHIGAWRIEMPDVLPQERNAGALDQSLPRLQHLHLIINAPLSPHFLAGSSASLTSLSLTFTCSRVPHVVAYPRLPALLHFVMKFHDGAVHAQEVLAVVNLLAHTPLLQTLLIDNNMWPSSLPLNTPPCITLPHLCMLSLVGCASLLEALVRILPRPSRSLSLQYGGETKRVDDDVLAYLHAFWMDAAPQSSLPGARVRFSGSFFHFQIGVPFREVTVCPPHVYLEVPLRASRCLPLPRPIEELHLDAANCTFDMAELGEDGAQIRQLTLMCATTMWYLPHDIDAWVRQRAAEKNKVEEVIVLEKCGDEVRDCARRWEADGVVCQVVYKT